MQFDCAAQLSFASNRAFRLRTVNTNRSLIPIRIRVSGSSFSTLIPLSCGFHKEIFSILITESLVRSSSACACAPRIRRNNNKKNSILARFISIPLLCNSVKYHSTNMNPRRKLFITCCTTLQKPRPGAKLLVQSISQRSDESSSGQPFSRSFLTTV